MESLKVMSATENFLAMPDKVKRCQIEAQEDCKSRRYVEEVQKECGCIPWMLSSVAHDQVCQTLALPECFKFFKIEIHNFYFLTRITTSAVPIKLVVPQD